MVWEQSNIHLAVGGRTLTPYVKISSVWVTDPNIKAKEIKLLEKHKLFFQPWGRQRFLGEVTESVGHKNKT